MNFQTLSILPLLISCILYLFDYIGLFGKRKILKKSKWISNIANLSILTFGFVRIWDEHLSWGYIFFFIVCCILIYQLFGYFFGTSYKVLLNDKDKLIRGIKNAVKEIEYTEVQMKEVNDKIQFIFPHSRRMIEISYEEATVGGDQAYKLSFKRWVGYGFRKDIIRYLEGYLFDSDSKDTISPIKIVGGILLAIVGIIASLFFISQGVMEPNRIQSDEIFRKEISAEVFVTGMNKPSLDQELLNQLYEVLAKNTYWPMKKQVTLEEVQNAADFWIQSHEERATLYVGKTIITLYIPYSEIGERSIFHWICWKMHNIYDKDTGIYYRTFISKNEYKELKHIIEDRENESL